MRFNPAPLAACCALLAVPAAAEASTRVVNMGPPPATQKEFFKYAADVNDFFPHGVTIRVGDSVKFVPSGFHTVDLLGQGDTPESFIVPTGDKVSGANDAGDSPFWFNGLDVLGANPKLFVGSFGKQVAYDGSERVNSGLPLGAKPQPMQVKFTKKGTFTYYCNIHVGMKGTVRVRPRSAKVPPARDVARASKAQVARDLKIAKPLPNVSAPAGTVYVGSAGSHGVEHLGFVPSTTTVPVGTTLEFRMSKRSFDGHTATTGPGNPETEPDSYIGKLSASFGAPVLDPAAAYPSEPPGGDPASLTPTSHGNGFWNTGTIDGSAATPIPVGGSVKFAAAGTYEFYCLIHPFMHATVEVR